jgi:hypothetical protein
MPAPLPAEPRVSEHSTGSATCPAEGNPFGTVLSSGPTGSARPQIAVDRVQEADAFRTAFRGFEVAKVAAMTELDVDRLVQEASIIATAARSRPPSTTPAR